jgi:hypothetical protein
LGHLGVILAILASLGLSWGAILGHIEAMLGPFSGCLGPCRGEVENHMGCKVGSIKTLLFPGKIYVFRRFGRLRWSQVGDIIGLLGGKPDKIETIWLGELDLEDLPCVLRGLGWFVGDVPRRLGSPGHKVWVVPRGLKGPGRKV